MSDSLLSLNALLSQKGWFFLFLVGSFFFLERFFGLRKQIIAKTSLQRWMKNYGLWLINTLLSLLIIIPIVLWAENHAWQWRSHWEWSLGLFILLDILLLDCWIYWWHRCNHVWPLLWRFHQVHHLDETLDSSSAVRFHYGEMILSALVRAGFIMVFNITLVNVIIFEMLLALAVLFQHSNLNFTDRWESRLARIIITPAIHWTHHHQRLPYTNSNYGSIFSFWDRLFGSFFKLPVTHRDQLPIGLEGRPDQSFFKLLLLPFQRVRSMGKTSLNPKA